MQFTYCMVYIAQGPFRARVTSEEIQESSDMWFAVLEGRKDEALYAFDQFSETWRQPGGDWVALLLVAERDRRCQDP